jgi:hypothetical protein
VDQETIKAIADQLADQTILTGWRTWSIQFALWLIGTGFVTFLAAYWTKRGENKAIRADFEMLKTQLADNTRVITEIAHEDWNSREWKTIRRQKLEELSKNLNLLLNETQAQAWDGLTKGQSPLYAAQSFREIQMLCNLYFPELRAVSHALEASYFEQHDWLVKAVPSLHDHTPRDQLKASIGNAFDLWVDEKSKNLQTVMAQMRFETAKLMQEIVGIKEETTSPPAATSSPPAAPAQ